MSQQPVSKNDGSICWSFQDDYGWKPYDDETNKQIETAYSNNAKEIKLNAGSFFGAPHRKNIYIIQFDDNNLKKTWVQINTKTGYYRSVNRNDGKTDIQTNLPAAIPNIKDDKKEPSSLLTLLSSSLSSPIPSSNNNTPCWVYNDNWEWKPYDSITNKQIESAFIDPNIKDISLNKGPFFGHPNRKDNYIIKFDRAIFPIICTQLNIKTGFIRQIIRSLRDNKSNDNNDIPPPPSSVHVSSPSSVSNDLTKKLKQKLDSVTKKNLLFENNNNVLNQEKNALTVKCKQLQSTNLTLIQYNQSLSKANEKYQAQIVKLQNGYNVLSKSMAALQIEKDKLILQLRSARMNNLDCTKYSNWSTEELIYWIINIDLNNFTQYNQILIKSLNEECVDGSCLNIITENDVKLWGIKNIKHRKIIYQKIYDIVQANPNNNNNNNDNNNNNNTPSGPGMVAGPGADDNKSNDYNDEGLANHPNTPFMG